MNVFQLDLLNFKTKTLDLVYRASGEQMDWLFEGTNSEFSLADDVEFVIDMEAELIDTTIRLTGEMQGAITYRCGRCLEMKRIVLDSDVNFVLMSRRSWQKSYESDEDLELSEEDLDVSYYEGEIIDLRPIIREAVFLELPTFAICPPESSDACDEAFENYIGEEAIVANEDASLDLRWRSLKGLKLGTPDKDVH